MLKCSEVINDHNLHKTEANHISPIDNCVVCENYVSHRNKYITARKEYEKDAESQLKSSDLIVSADLQKVIMLPRADMFKEVIFTRRIIAFNESFVAVGKGRNVRPLGILWHEGISGRKKEDIVSSFYAFFLKNRDKESITIWLDNCSAQNKNWCLFSFFIYIVNATEVNLKQLTIKYFERGHTFMSADHFHHQVEKSLKRAKTVWDFNDYVQCVLNSTKQTDVAALEIRNFYKWTDLSSKYKLQKLTPRCYLNNISLAIFTRGEKTLKYKNSYDAEDLIELNFLTAGAFKTGVTIPPSRTSNRGISQERKQHLLNNLQDIIPGNRRNFWEELPVGDAAEEEENG
ncbi:uncharacterized protein LOC126891429 [Diabrotica virgifera virgifera]|uniref:DUF7869 domain-containing protein n=1 Tax=Diabrotica virgifera virgifera TaxID=50390 RepID=A0ABM5L291_DIAVI|nr:uncharacterized protein LOC126891429 [Diabrotica virgifera virgifera]